MREMVLVLVVAAGCTSMLPAERESMEYEKMDARLRATEQYDALRTGCSAAGGTIVLEGSGSRLPRSSKELSSARCVKGPPHIAF